MERDEVRFVLSKHRWCVGKITTLSHFNRLENHIWIRNVLADAVVETTKPKQIKWIQRTKKNKMNWNLRNCILEDVLKIMSCMKSCSLNLKYKNVVFALFVSSRIPFEHAHNDQHGNFVWIRIFIHADISIWLNSYRSTAEYWLPVELTKISNFFGRKKTSLWLRISSTAIIIEIIELTQSWKDFRSPYFVKKNC